VLFALIDYIRYRREVGVYSTASLTAGGAFVATAESFARASSRLRFGDALVVHTRDSAMSWAVMYCTGMPWSHVACVEGSDTIVHATVSGIVRQPLSVFFDGRTILSIARPPREFSAENVAAMRAFLESSIGGGYAWGKAGRLWRAIVLGKHPSYRFRVSADFVLLAAVLAIIPSDGLRVILAAATAAYLAVVGYNTRLRFRGSRWRGATPPEPE
jgi:hypothetical protein